MSDQTTTVPQAPAPAPAKRRLVDRLWGLKALIAVALASVIIGGLGGAALAHAGESQGGNSRFGRSGPGGGFGGPGGGFGGGFNRQNGGRHGFGGGPGQQNGQQNGPQNGQQPLAPPSAGSSAGRTS